MAKQSGLGDAFYWGGVDVSGDTNSLGRVSGSQGLLDVTDITQLAHSRLGGKRDAGIDFVSYFDPAIGASHAQFSPLPTTDVGVMYCRGTSLGSPAASLIAKQLNYDGTRAEDGGFTLKVSAAANAFGLEWGKLATPGMRTDTAATNGTAIDDAASSAFGAQAYLHVASVVGTSVTVAVQDSADNVTFANVTGLAFTAVAPGGAPQTQRLATANNAALRRYVRIATTGTFTSAVFAVAYIRNPIAGQVF